MIAGPEQQHPVTRSFSVHREGDGVLSLTLHAVAAPTLLKTLSELAASFGGSLHELGDGEYLLTQRPPRPEHISALPSSILMAPESSLPQDLGASLALALSEDGHAVVLSRDPKHLAACLRPLIESESQRTELPETGLLALVEPGEFDSWFELEHLEYRGHRVLHFRARSHQATLESWRWVAPAQGGSWRSGWSW